MKTTITIIKNNGLLIKNERKNERTSVVETSGKPKFKYLPNMKAVSNISGIMTIIITINRTLLIFILFILF